MSNVAQLGSGTENTIGPKEQEDKEPKEVSEGINCDRKENKKNRQVQISLNEMKRTTYASAAEAARVVSEINRNKKINKGKSKKKQRL